MLTTTAIPYLTRTFGAARGCSMKCPYCSTRRWAHRLKCAKCRSGEVHFHPERLGDPAKARKPQVIGVSFYDELFDPQRPDGQVHQVLDACAAAPQHQYVFLTKRPEMAALWCSANQEAEQELPHLDDHDNWWVGVTAETQGALDARALVLLGLGIKHLWLSIEPILGPVKPMAYLGLGRYEFVAAGCLSGGFASDANEKEQCLDLRHLAQISQSRVWNLPLFVKQVPVAGRCSRDSAEWPEELRVQQLPKAWERIIRRLPETVPWENESKGD